MNYKTYYFCQQILFHALYDGMILIKKNKDGAAPILKTGEIEKPNE
jgi:uncharacterized protein YehS (DUF1456 family)